jgi:hypothetical protein
MNDLLDAADAETVELEAEVKRLRDTLKHVARILSFGGDAEILDIVTRSLEQKN